MRLTPARTRAALPVAGLALALAVALMVVVVVARAGEGRPAPTANPPPTLDGRITGFLTAQHAEQPYRDPTVAERAAAAIAFDNRAAFADLGFTAIEDVDHVTGRRYLLLLGPTDDRAWGAVLLDLTQPTTLAIEVPHPRTDIGTEGIGLDLFRAVPGSLVLFAGAHRRAAAEKADVAHNEDSLFQEFAVALARRGVPQVQLHGFADLNLPAHDLVVSTGNDEPNPLAARMAKELAGAGLDACRAWAERCGRLEGTTNVQGRAAAADGAVFVHVEMSNSVRTDDGKRADLVGALAAAVREAV